MNTTTTRSMDLKEHWLKIADDLVRRREKMTIQRSPDYWNLLGNIFTMGHSPFWACDYVLNLTENLQSGKKEENK